MLKEIINKYEEEIKKFSESLDEIDNFTINNLNSKEIHQIYEIIKKFNLNAETLMHLNSTNKYIVIKKNKNIINLEIN